MSTPNAAEALVGFQLDAGWTVVEKIDRPVNATGGNFCVGYKVKNVDGRHGFLKALNYARALSHPDPAGMLSILTNAYLFERDLMRDCGASKMSRVVVSLADGQVQVPGFPIPAVSYIIFELADRDIRSELDMQSDMDLSSRLYTLHHVATGLKQLHQRRIAHQDLKPSNVLVFNEMPTGRTSKVADLGRATDASRQALHDDFQIAGDPSYAPPEQLYRAVPIEFGARRLACDLYQLGSLATFIFSGATMNSLIVMQIEPSHWFTNWSGTYDDVLPYVRDAFVHAVDDLRARTSDLVSKEIADMVAYLCDPEPSRRGHPASRRSHQNPYALDRIVTDIDLLVKRLSVRQQRRAV